MMSTVEVFWTDALGDMHRAGTLHQIGTVGLQQFEYHPDWLTSHGFDLGEGLPVGRGPLLPPGGALEFGLFADAAPDAWGRRVLTRKLSPAPRTPTELLLGAADATRQGALRFVTEPGQPPISDGGAAPMGTLGSLYQEVRDFQAGREPAGEFSKLLRVGTSQGGFRPKAVVIDESGALWIAKFPSETDTYDVETCEAAALHVARDAGLAVPAFRHVRIDQDRAMLLVRRFDRSGQGRLGYQSMRTAARSGAFDDLDHQTASRVSGYLCGVAGLRATVTAAALNIAVNNIDDHSRNTGLLQDDQGRWSPAPLFDVVPYPHAGSGTPLVAGSERSIEQLLDLDWGLPRPELTAWVDRVVAAASTLYTVAERAYGLDPEAARNAEAWRRTLTP